jgi:hypothetical protein
MVRRRLPVRASRQGLRCYVFTEGAVTEPEYLDVVKACGDRLAVKVDNRHGGADVIVPLAIALTRELAMGLPSGAVPQVWCVFDHDGDERGDFNRLIDDARRAGVQVAFSHPCFELWLLLHHRDFGAPARGRCGPVAQELRKCLPRYHKAVQLSDVRGRYQLARDRAVRLAKQHQRDGRTHPTQCDPSTNVHELIDRLGVSY